MVGGFGVPPHPGSSGEAVSRRMSALRRRDNEGELAVRRLLYAAGYRYRVAYPVPGHARRTIDIALTRRKVAVFIDGCFWHGCPRHGTRPRSNAEWWSVKLAANQARDQDTTSQLLDAGWSVVRAWEHEDPAVVVRRVLEALQCEGPANSSTGPSEN
ncbi:very short patch repair endonuclease [Cellulomonas sp. KRMCY2]|uniref:very short patch repair endonuclease n=1 Tax=Cellulomonas sp. KRMCY2 TaxID=1304865 RepID=UPI00045E9843|nr:very short patch repair endonuclease [Cellulomonas sp. KRMCY2]